jgi:hypothetical protein
MKYLAAMISCACLTLAHAGDRTTPSTSSPDTGRATLATASMPMAFEPNQGQTDALVQYLARGSGYTIFLEPTRATFALLRGANSSAGGDGENSVIRMNVVGADDGALLNGDSPLSGTVNYFRSRDTAAITGLPTYAHVQVKRIYRDIDLVYYGANGRLEYDFVVAPHADPSVIKLRFDGAKAQLAANGDLVLHQAASTADRTVRLQRPVVYQDIRGQHRRIDGRFMLASNNTVGFRLGAYDHSYKLTIDPVLAYASYIGGSTQSSQPNGMAVNAAGQIYLVGTTFATDFPTTAGVISPACPIAMTGQKKCGASSLSAAFVSKIAADGQSLIYSTYLGGSGAGPGEGGASQSAGGNGADFAVGVAVDAADEAWVLGGTNSNNFPITADALQPYCSPTAKTNGSGGPSGEFSGCAAFNGGSEYIYGATSLFIVKLNPTGTQVDYGTFLGGTQGETPAAIALDATGNVYVASTAATLNNLPFAQGGQYNYPTTGTAYQTTGLSGSLGLSAAVTELSADGHSLLYSTFFSAPDQTFATALAVNAGKIFLGGYTQSPHLPTTAGALSTTCPANPNQCANNAYVAEFDPTKSGAASLVFSTYLNGSHPSGSGLAFDNSQVGAMAADSSGNVYIAGGTQYTDFPTTAGVLQPTCNAGSHDFCQTGFVTKLSGTGAMLWSTFYGSPSNASGTFGIAAMALDASDNVYIANNSAGAGDFPTKNSLFNYSGGAMVLAELSSDGTQVLFGTFYGTASNVFPTGLAITPTGNIVFSGYTAATDLPLVKALQASAAGGFNEGFFAEISTQKLTSSIALAIAPATTTTGTSVTMTATVTGQTGQAAPTGTVTFKNGSTALGTGTVTAGVATFTSTTLAAGTYSVIASYAGDTNYAASASTAQALAITAPAPPAPTVTIAISPTSITVGAAGTLTWSSTNATSCTASGSWSGSQVTSGTAQETPTAAGTDTYTLACTGAGGTATASATLTVNAAAVTPPPATTGSGGHSGGGAFDWVSIMGLLCLVGFTLHKRKAI